MSFSFRQQRRKEKAFKANNKQQRLEIYANASVIDLTGKCL